MSQKKALTLGIPKGSLEASTLSIFEQVGLQFSTESRTLWLDSNDPEIAPVLLKPQDIPVYVKSGRLDAGLSGLDWITEQDAWQSVESMVEIPFSRQTHRPIRWVLALPYASRIRSVDDLRLECDNRRAQGTPFVIATELLRISRMWLARNGIDATPEFSWGATEAKAERFADAIIEASETGVSLRANHLREIAEVFRSTIHFIANRQIYQTDEWKKQKLLGLKHLLRGALRANDFVELRIVAKEPLNLDLLVPKARDVVLSLSAPGERFAATVTLLRTDVPTIVPTIIAAGASDVCVLPMTVYYTDADVRDDDAKIFGSRPNVLPRRQPGTTDPNPSP